MSQSRSRKAQSSGGETRGRSSVVKESGDADHTVHQAQPKTKQNSKTKNKIPKSIRYDLDNALVSLCDVWFDDIKPHLVRNKIKLHVDSSGATTTASGDCRRTRPGAPSCSHHDPGSDSDVRATETKLGMNKNTTAQFTTETLYRLQRTPVNSAAFLPTPPTASKVRFARQPTSRPQSPIHAPRGATTQNKYIKKSPKVPREEVPPKSPLPPAAGRPRLCLSCQPSDLSPRTKKRRLHTAPPLYNRDSILTLTGNVLKKSKKSQTNITWVNYQSRYADLNLVVSPSKYRKPRAQQKLTSQKKSPNSDFSNSVKLFPKESSTKKLSNTEATSSNHRPTSPEVLKKLTKDVPVNTTTIDPARDRHQSREKKPNKNSVKSKKQTERKVDPSMAQQTYDTEDKSNSHFWRCFATTNLNQAKSKECVKNHKMSNTDCNVIFDQDLIDIIGTKNDKRLRILYNSPMREESNSVLNLLPSPNQRVLEARSKRKNIPWK